MATSEEIADQAKREILDDIAAGLVPASVTDFSALHQHVDANCYGGAEALFDAAHDAVPDTEEGHTAAWNSFCTLVNPAFDAVDAWIKSGGIAAGMASRAK